MTDLLTKIFVKDSENTSDENVRRAYGVFAGRVGIFLNICLFVLKLIAGILTSSIGIAADALNNLSDAGSSVITMLGFKLSGKPADNDHPFGHGRIEYLSALFVSVIILLMGLELAKSSVVKIINPEKVDFSFMSLCILLCAVVVKAFMYFFYRHIGIKISSQTIKAASKDSISDCISTFAVIVGILFAKIFKINTDGIIGLIVSVFIIYTGFETIKDSLSPLLGNPPDKELVKELEDTILAHKEILGIHDMVIHDYGPTRFMISVHAEVSAKSDFLEIHEIIDETEKELCNKFKCEAVIHMDPIETDNAVINEMRPYIAEFVKKLDDRITIHDFRVVAGNRRTNIIFDIVVPFEVSIPDSEIVKLINDEVHNKNNSYYAVINVDKSYIK